MYYTSTVFLIQRSVVRKKRTWVIYVAYEDPISMSQVQEVLAK